MVKNPLEDKIKGEDLSSSTNLLLNNKSVISLNTFNMNVLILKKETNYVCGLLYNVAYVRVSYISYACIKLLYIYIYIYFDVCLLYVILIYENTLLFFFLLLYLSHIITWYQSRAINLFLLSCLPLHLLLFFNMKILLYLTRTKYHDLILKPV